MWRSLGAQRLGDLGHGRAAWREALVSPEGRELRWPGLQLRRRHGGSSEQVLLRRANSVFQGMVVMVKKQVKA